MGLFCAWASVLVCEDMAGGVFWFRDVRSTKPPEVC